jgi:MYXO-CTERM domain-containing protein
VADLGVCGCAGPTDDRSCGLTDSGLICSGVGGFCVPGCGPAPRNGCPTGQSCLDIVNGVGDCSGAMCHTDADCRAPLAHCDLSGGSADGRCVQCLFDTDCDAPLVCDGTKKKCLECSPGKTDQCRPELAGSQCLTDGRCGCAADVDCGGVTSGRVCDAAASRCVPGCRGTGGNGCPMEQVCTSITSDVGRCDPAPSSDGGADGSTDGRVDGGSDVTSDGAADSTSDGRDAGGGDAVADAAADTRADASSSDTSADGSRSDTGAGGDASDDGSTNIGLDRFIAGGGCHCATAPSSPSSPWAAALAGLALVLLRRRRRR